MGNNITEIVYNEGASDAKILTNNDSNGITSTGSAISKEPITRIQAIRNTEYSLDKYKLTYHCGSDIFNNHLLRNKENVSVQKRDNSNKKTCDISRQLSGKQSILQRKSKKQAVTFLLLTRLPSL